MDGDLIRRTGEALYGPHWQTDLANDLGVSYRTMRYWMTGAREPRAGVFVDLLRIVTERQSDLDQIAERLKREAAPGA